MKPQIALALFLVLPAASRAVFIEDELPASAIKVTASSTYSKDQSEQHLIDGSGLSGDLHDNAGGAQTMWHSNVNPAASRPAAGLPEFPAWVRFDFATPQPVSEILVWNHNQAGLTNRGFNKTCVFTSPDGTSWTSSPAELPGGTGAAVAIQPGTEKPVSSIILAAYSNFGGDCYGLSEVRFLTRREVAEYPAPTGLQCAPRSFYGYRPDGQAGREVVIMFEGPRLYEAARLEVDCDGVKETTAIPAAPRGLAGTTLLLPAAVTNACTAKITLHAGRTELTRTVDVPEARRWEMYILMHSHVDIGYTHLQPEIERKQAQNVLRALELVPANRALPEGARFKWNLEVQWVADQFARIATPDQWAAFEQAVRDGIIGVDAMYGNLLTGLARGEELVHQLAYAVNFGRKCGVTVDSMMISDVPGLTWGLIPALNQAGVKYVSNGPNYIDRIGWTRVTWEDKPFWWVGPNGKDRVLYWSSFFGYAYGHTMDHVTDAVIRDIKQLEEKGYPYDITHIRWSKGDNGSADERVIREVQDWNRKYAYPKLIIATTSEMFHAFEKRYGDQIPSFRGDFTPYWEDGAGSSSRETGLNRGTADRLLQAEALWAMRNPGPFPSADFDAAWKKAAMYSEHTWGAHNSVSQPDIDFVRGQWKYKQGYALEASSRSTNLLARALAPGEAAAVTGAFDVFNTFSWARTDLAELPEGTSGNIVRDEAGAMVPSQRLSNGRLAFLAADVPAFGARRYRVEQGIATPSGRAVAAAATLTTPLLSVRLDETTGAVTSLRRAGIDAELVGGNVNSYLYLPGANVADAKPNGPVKITVLENGPLVAALRVESDAPGCAKLVRDIRVVDGLDRVEFSNVVDKLPVRQPEGVHIGFEFNVPDATVRMNSPLAVTEPEKDQIPGACKNWFSIERWVDVANTTHGVTWSTTDAPLVEMGGLTANLLRGQPNPNAYLKTIAASPRLYSWVMNNHWHTNYKADQEGPTPFRYAVRPHKGYDPVAAEHFGAESTRQLLVTPAVGASPAAPLLRVEPAGVVVTALKPGTDGKAWIVRLHGISGRDESAKITVPAGARVTYTDVTEQAGAAAPALIPVSAGSLVALRIER
ncbi:MAG: hypothetical protein U1F77_04210 [Kiritimatiellia bacterium]